MFYLLKLFSLSKQLANKSVYRVYDLVVYGNIIAGGTIDEPIKRHPVDRVKMAILPGGRDAVTHYNVKERFRDFTRVQARLETGRTHQIRVHLATLGHSVVGDVVYGGARSVLSSPRPMLHATSLSFTHPVSGKEMKFSVDLPSDFAAVLAKCSQRVD